MSGSMRSEDLRVESETLACFLSKNSMNSKFIQRQIVFADENVLKMKHHVTVTDTAQFLG